MTVAVTSTRNENAVPMVSEAKHDRQSDTSRSACVLRPAFAMATAIAPMDSTPEWIDAYGDDPDASDAARFRVAAADAVDLDRGNNPITYHLSAPIVIPNTNQKGSLILNCRASRNTDENSLSSLFLSTLHPKKKPPKREA